MDIIEKAREIGSSILAAGVPTLGEKMKVKSDVNSTSRISDKVSLKSSYVSPGKPTMISLVSERPSIFSLA